MDEKIREYIVNAFPIQWVEYSEELRDASELIWNESKNTWVHNNFPIRQNKPGLSRTYFLNIGFSLENLIKGLLISENPDYLKNGKISPEISSGHNLENLISKITTLNFDEKEMDFLKILSKAIPNWSRYPIPKRWETENNEKIVSEDIRKQFLEMWNKIGFKIYELTKDGWNGPNGVKLDIWRSSYFEGTLNFEIPNSKK
ncbi:hypothetical protein ED312_08730 [Sinomicrobium pectinilyticum]|uniref:Uncharacterized protein n=1 Tax=Sinomicrobium pectinilyticum TaxID=1084421 RepID=A0A3N0EL70_SINP1|nr:hypothetical protein [Sinomicrobium pectinilyticum]RNL88522.1 hypothetical protein ED312_08730 [Sinomicrobium pectinilyticum]